MSDFIVFLRDMGKERYDDKNKKGVWNKLNDV